MAERGGMFRVGAGGRTGVSTRRTGCETGRGGNLLVEEAGGGLEAGVDLNDPSSKSSSAGARGGNGSTGACGWGLRLRAELTYACAA